MPSLAPVGPPQLLDKLADYEIPARVWSNWKPEKGSRTIMRTLTAAERSAVQVRAANLDVGLGAFTPNQIEIVDCAIDAMFAGFRSMRQSGDSSAATTEITRAVLRPFPAWAIEQGCLKIARHQAGLDPHWPPNDGEIYDVVAKIVAPYGTALVNARALLSAPVESPEPQRPTQAEIEAKLGRPISDGSRVSRPPVTDGKHAQRVMADMAGRKQQEAS